MSHIGDPCCHDNHIPSLSPLPTLPLCHSLNKRCNLHPFSLCLSLFSLFVSSTSSTWNCFGLVWYDQTQAPILTHYPHSASFLSHLCYLFDWDRFSLLYSSGCPGTHYADQAGLELMKICLSLPRESDLSDSSSMNYLKQLHGWKSTSCSAWPPDSLFPNTCRAVS